MEAKQDAAKSPTLFGGAFGRWLDNFWYHYKGVTLVVLFALIVGIVCTVQICSRPPKADFNLVYAGEADLRPTASNTDHEKIVSSLGNIAPKNADGETPTFEFYFYQIFTGDYVPSQSANANNIESLKDELDLGAAFIYLMDEEVYKTYTANASGDRYVVSVAPYLPEGSTARLTEDGCGVYLHSLPLGQAEGFSSLPEDTVLCLRVKFTFSNMLGASDTDGIYPLYEELFRRMLAE